MKTNMKSPLAIIVLVAVVTALALSAAFAAPAGKAKNTGVGIDTFKQIAKELNLTDAQKTQIKAIMKEHRAEAQKINQSSMTADEKKAALLKLRKGTQEKVVGVLTPEQKAQLDKIRASRKEKRDELGECLKSLDLTADQKTQIQTIRTDTHAKVKAVQVDTTLTPQQKIQQILQIRKDSRQKMLALLTPEQREKLNECLKASKAGQTK